MKSVVRMLNESKTIGLITLAAFLGACNGSDEKISWTPQEDWSEPEYPAEATSEPDTFPPEEEEVEVGHEEKAAVEEDSVTMASLEGVWTVLDCTYYADFDFDGDVDYYTYKVTYDTHPSDQMIIEQITYDDANCNSPIFREVQKANFTLGNTLESGRGWWSKLFLSPPIGK